MNWEDTKLDEHVYCFCEDYLPKVLTGEEKINHSYNDRFLQGRQRDGKRRFETLQDAFYSYYWPGPDDNFSENSAELKTIQTSLRRARESSNENHLYDALEDTLCWGAGRRRNKLYIGNMAWLDAKVGTEGISVSQILNTAEKAFAPEEFLDESLVNGSIRSNAGFTKIYALAFDGFIIYDSRVAAALGIIIRSYCKRKGLQEVPKNLALGRMNAVGRDNRDPSEEGFKFPYLGDNHPGHAKSNWLANRFLSCALEELEKSKDGLPEWLSENRNEEPASYGTMLRKVEAALFMLGKDIPLAKDFEVVESQPNNTQTIETVAFGLSGESEREWKTATTLVQKSSFIFREDDEGNVEIRYGKEFKSQHVCLYEDLRAVVEKLCGRGCFQNGTAQPVAGRARGSFGRLYYEQSHKTAGVISYILAYLNKRGVIEECQRGKMKLVDNWKLKLGGD